MVEVFDNRVEIVNPGGLPKGITDGNFFKVIFKRVFSASSEAEKLIIKALKSKPAITRKKLQDVTGLSSSKIYGTIMYICL